MVRIDDIRSRLAGNEPSLLEAEGRRLAAVAMVMCDGADGPEVLFIERARHDADPWSGHMAFPGGRIDPGDVDERSAAERETLEEVGVSLESAEYLGRLDDIEGRQRGRPAGLIISGHVYRLPTRQPLAINYEVETAFWFPVASLLDPELHVGYESRQTAGMRFPGVLVGEPDRHVVWGLTYRFLEVFFEAIGRALPPHSWPDRTAPRRD